MGDGSSKTGGDRPGIRVCHVACLDPVDVGTLHGVPITAPARTLVDLAAIVPGEQLERAVANARRTGWVGEGDLWRQVDRSRGRRGVGRMRSLLARDGEPAFTRSAGERRLLRLGRAHGIPEPEANAPLAGYEVDFLWREARLVVEVDGYAYHADRVAFGRDRAKSNELQLLGYTVLRFTWRQLTETPEVVAARIRAALLRRDRD